MSWDLPTVPPFDYRNVDQVKRAFKRAVQDGLIILDIFGGHAIFACPAPGCTSNAKINVDEGSKHEGHYFCTSGEASHSGKIIQFILRPAWRKLHVNPNPPSAQLHLFLGGVSRNEHGESSRFSKRLHEDAEEIRAIRSTIKGRNRFIERLERSIKDHQAAIKNAEAVIGETQKLIHKDEQRIKHIRLSYRG